MPRFFILRFALTAALAVSLSGSDSILPGNPVTVHEWGTFTTVAGRDGEPVAWAPLSFKSDLPCFVHSLGSPNIKFGQALVRMETPVVYFYTKTAARLSVHVDFPDGWITEWYPGATKTSPDSALLNRGTALRNGGIEWAQLNVLPDADLPLPSTKDVSRYYAARATDSAALQSGSESEKLLFYRGVANFRPPLEPVVGPDGVRLNKAVPVIILFSNQSGHIGYRILRDAKDTTFLANPELIGSMNALRHELTDLLVQSGLYPKEASAMVETWRDSWFEEGTRIFYIMPRTAVDVLLPMRIAPAPAEIHRVFVGRTELLSPWTEATLRRAMADGDTAALGKFNRFASVFLAQMNKDGAPKQSDAAKAYLNKIQASGASCVK